jgi:membrane-associated protein
MDEIIQYICENIHLAPLIFFGLLILAGFNIPISEDILLLTGGMISATCAPPGFFFVIYLALFLGCIISGWQVYWIGRLLGPKLYHIKWTSYLVQPGRVAKLNYYYEKYGALTFFVVRFIPGGVRNVFFMTSGLGKMPFGRFVIRDFFACLLSTNVIFYLGYLFAENYATIVRYFKRYNLLALVVFLGVVITVGLIIYFRKKRKNHTM